MKWYPLGHAMALAEAAGLRFVFDPLLEDRHHGGVFDVEPKRSIHAEALQADFVVVSHRHPDHFDVPSLRRLAALDADSVVLTPDALVARVAERLGFRTVRCVAPSTRIELDGVRMVTTPSRANDAPIAPEALEWGVALSADDAIVWNQVDTIHRNVAELRATVDTMEAEHGARLAMSLVRWCPLLEVEASLAGCIGFPFAAYGQLLEQAAAIAERGAVVVPGSAGARHATPFASMNALVYPVDEARFLRDLARRVPTLRAHPNVIGHGFAITHDGVHLDEGGGRSLVTPETPFEDRDYRPLAIPPLSDPNLEGRDEGELRAFVDAWVRGDLARALRRRSGRFVLEVVFPSSTDAWSIVAAAGETRVVRALDRDWDVRNEVAGSWLCEVVEGRRHWGDLLLAGVLRACTRAYEIGPRGLVRSDAAPIFLYEAISYASSVERSVEHTLVATS